LDGKDTWKTTRGGDWWGRDRCVDQKRRKKEEKNRYRRVLIHEGQVERDEKE